MLHGCQMVFQQVRNVVEGQKLQNLKQAGTEGLFLQEGRWSSWRFESLIIPDMGCARSSNFLQHAGIVSMVLPSRHTVVNCRQVANTVSTETRAQRLAAALAETAAAATP